MPSDRKNKAPKIIPSSHRSIQQAVGNMAVRRHATIKLKVTMIKALWLRCNQRFGRNRTRLVAGLFAVLMLLTISLPLIEQLGLSGRYHLGAAQLKLVGTTDESLAKQLTYDASKRTYVFNKDVINSAVDSAADPVASLQKAAIGAENKSNTKTYALTIPEDFSEGVTYYDANSKLSFKLIPQFDALRARTEQGHLVFPSADDRQVVYTLKNNGLKEDILLPKATNDTETYSYKFDLPKSLEVRAIPNANGAVGIYSADPALFGNVSYATDSDRAKVAKARENTEKTNLVFALPAPVVTTASGNVGKTTARFELKGNDLSVVAENLLSAGDQPLSIDPSVVVTSTSDFEYGGNNEGNIDFSTSGQVTRGALTGGDIGTWTATTSLSYENEWSSSVFYNGYMYVVGGNKRTAPAQSYTTVSYVPVNSDGTLGSWGTTTSLPYNFAQHKVVAYNGYLYTMGGLSSSVASDLTYYAPINSDGTIGTWVQTTSLPAVNTAFGAAAYNGFIYIAGGNFIGSSNLYSEVYYAPLRGNGSIGTWQSTTSLSYPRTTLTANIYNGYIYVFGGANATPSFVADVQYAKINADGTLGSWMTTNSFTGARYGHISTFYNGYVYLYGGWTGSYPTTLQYAQVNANGSLSTWTTSVNNISGGRTYVAGGAYKGYLYIGSGWNNTVNLADFQYVKIDPPGENMAFTNNSNSIGTARRYVQTVAIYGWLYVLGGDTGAAASTALGRMPINADGTLGVYTTTGITQLSSAGGARMLFGAFAYDGYMYVIGGCKTTLASCNTAGNTLNTVYRGNISISTGNLDTWTVQTSLNTSRYGFATAVFNNYVYVIGGTADGGGAPLDTIEYANFDLATGTLGSWTTASSGYNLPAGLTNFSAVANGSTLYIAGGCTTGTPVSCSAQTNAVYHATLSATGGFASSWSSGGTDASVTNARYGASLTVMNGMLYMVGGYDGTSYYADLQYAPIGSNGVVGAWQTGNPIAASAVGPSMTSQNGVLYVVGGYNGSYQTTVRRAIVNNGGRGQTGTWVTNGTDLSSIYATGLGYSRSVAVNGHIYLIAGNSGSTTSTVSYAALGADGSVGSWATTSSLQTARFQHAAFTYNGYIYAVGGQTGAGVRLTSVEYAKINANGTVGSWAYTTSLSSTWGGLSGVDGAVYKGYMYLTGGTDGTTVQNEAQYAQINADGTLGSWTDASTFTTARQLHSSFAINGYLYIVGGYSGAGSYFADIQSAPINSNGSLGTWSYTSPLPVAGKGMIVVPYNGYVYAYTGNTNTGRIGMNTYSWYAPLNADGSIGDWQMIIGPMFTTSRASSSGVIYDGYMYVLGGNTSPFYSDVQYTPVNVMARKGQYSITLAINAKTINSITYNGILPGTGSVAYNAYSTNGTLVASGRSGDGISIIGNACATLGSSAAYLTLSVTLDDTTNGGGVFADESSTSTANVTDITVNYEPGHPPPTIRLRHGQTLQTGALSALDTCVAP